MDKVSREKIKMVVTAAFNRHLIEEARKRTRLCELTGAAPALVFQEKMVEPLLPPLIELSVDNAVGDIDDNELLNKTKEVVKEFVKKQAEQNSMGLLVGQADARMEGFFNQAMPKLIDNIVAHLVPPGYEKRVEDYSQAVFKFAQDKNVAPEDVFNSDELYKEFMRQRYTREEYEANMARSFAALDIEVLSEIFKPLLASLIPDEEASKEMWESLKDTMKVFGQEKIDALKNTVVQLQKEEVARIYG